MITIAEKRDAIIMANKYPNALIIEVSYSSMRYIKYKVLNPYGMLNPFYPHGKIQVPFTDGYTGVSVSAIWNSLKVFEDADVDAFTIKAKKRIREDLQAIYEAIGRNDSVDINAICSSMIGYIAYYNERCNYER